MKLEVLEGFNPIARTYCALNFFLQQTRVTITSRFVAHVFALTIVNKARGTPL